MYGARERPPGWARQIFYAGPRQCPAIVRDLALEHLDDNYWYDISGESFRKPAFEDLLGDRRESVVVVALLREPSNPKDPHAVAVKALFARRRLLGEERVIAAHIGYIPKGHARRVSEFIRHHEADTSETVMVSALLMQWHDEHGHQGFTARLSSEGMKEITRCIGVTKKGTACQSSASEGLLTCRVHDPDRATKQAARAKAPKVAVEAEVWRQARELREGDLVLQYFESSSGRFASPLLVTSVETVRELVCSETQTHEDWCAEWRSDSDDDWECPRTTVLISTVGPRGGGRTQYCSPNDEVLLAVTK